MIDLKKVFDTFAAGIVIIPSEINDFYINPEALSLLGMKEGLSSEALHERIQQITHLSMGDLKMLASRPGRDFFSVLFMPEEADHEEIKQLSSLSLSFYLSAADMILLIRQASLPARVLTVKEKLMAMAMHDVRTPISSVKESSSLVYDGTVGELNDMQKKCMDIACKEIVRVHRIVENIARIGQFEEQALEQNIRPVSIKAVMTRAGELVKEKLMRKKVKLVPGQEPDNKIMVLASEKGLNNSFYYLFDYILGKTEPSTDLSLDCEVKDGLVSLRFQYTGTIPSLEQRETIFSDFWANKETALIRKEHIDAFSLQICRFHIENIGGKIEIREIPDSGKVQFLIFLPVR